MDYEWTKTLWKSVRTAAMVVVVGGVYSFLGGFDSPEELEAAGVPAWLAPVGATVIAAGVTAIRNWIAVNRPQWNVVKKAGAKVQPVLKG